MAHPEPWNLTVTENGETRPAIVAAIGRCDTTRRGKDIFNLPTELVIEAFKIIGGPIGYVAGVSYAEEGNRHYRATLGPPPGFEHYVYCGHSDRIISARESRDNRWEIPDEKTGIYRWRLRKPGLFQGRAWMKADIVWLCRHPTFTDFEPVDVTAIINHLWAAIDAENPWPASAPPEPEREETPRERGSRERREGDWQNQH